MRFTSLTLLTLLPVQSGASSVATYSCPSSGSISVPAGEVVRLEKADSDKLCTLTRSHPSQISLPVGRSYSGNSWETVAGPFMTLRYDCDDEKSYCEVEIPDKTSAKQDFKLTSFKHTTSKKDEVARFLEQATFGTTHKDLESIDTDLSKNTDLSIILSQWLYNQIHDVKPTSHRATWRRLVAPRQDTPFREGRRRSPCEVGARWRRAAFGYSDSFKEIRIEKEDEKFSLSIDGIFRTMVPRIRFRGKTKFEYKWPSNYTICRLRFDTFGKFGIKYNGNCEELDIGNPSISIESAKRPKFVFPVDISEDNYVMEKSRWDMVEVMVAKEPLSHTSCSSIEEDFKQNIYAELSNGQIMIFEPTLAWLPNTAKKPLNDGGGISVIESNGVAQCPNVPRTFLNERGCKRSKKYSSCAPTGKIEGKIILDSPTLTKMYEVRNHPVYAIKGLPLDGQYVASPCEPDTRSRWKKTSGDACEGSMHTETQNIFRALIKSSKDSNADLKDVYIPGDSICHEHDKRKLKMSLWVNGECYISVHPDESNVYSFKRWGMNHPGGKDVIMAPAKQGNHEISFPKSHTLSRWNEQKDSELEYVGRLGDKVPFEDIPLSIKGDVKIAEAVGVHSPKEDGYGTLVCGSPNEEANDGISTVRYTISQTGLDRGIQLEDQIQQRKTVWTTVTVNAKDQLRQRMAWALSQILVISPAAMESHNTEIFLNYYDIFVRNAFGNYREVLREVAYSPQMALMLTYFESKSSEYTWSNGQKQYADENFAREIMQLFTIGLEKLNMDGSPVLDNQGNKILTYTNDDITEYARAWTGFTQQAPRGNVEDRDNTNNGIDPMRISALWRDHFPKLGLDGQHIGDTYPMCSDIPTNAFLRRGAKYRLLGNNQIPDDQDLFLQDYTSEITTTILDSNSKLRQRLCGSWGNNECNYPGVVELDWSIDCTGIECNIDSIKVVMVDEGVYYEYVRPACVHFPIFEDGKLIAKKARNQNEDSVCAHPDSFVAASACCDGLNVATHSTCNYTGERVPYSIAKSRCFENGKEVCDYSHVKWNECDICCNYNGYFWTDVHCEITLIVADDGSVAIERTGGVAEDEYDSLTYFRVNWASAQFPHRANSCGSGPCKRVGDYCRCPIEVVNERVFSSKPKKYQVLSKLHIGGVHPDMTDYEDTITADDIVLHVLNKDYPYSKHTVFQVDDKYGRRLYLKNMSSTVRIRGTTFKFRNPPSFYNAVPEAIDAQFETEATIDQYFYHENTAPFLALRFMQRFGISNPSPGYIKRVSAAFQSGLSVPAEASGVPAFGSGQYGCLSAMIAAILMDRESRDVLLDSDPTFGSIREPLVKVISLMRNLNYQQTDGGLLKVGRLQTRIGEESHEHPSVFSFYLPEYSPPHLKPSSLVSPEAMLLPQAPALIDGMLSMIKFGLTSCYGGFADKYCDKYMLPDGEGDYGTSIGRLTYSRSGDDVIDDLATILTSGRMSTKTREVIKSHYSATKDSDSALRLAEQLVIAAPSFHTTGKSEDVQTARVEPLPAKKTCKRHKAVVHLMLKGGCDSFNVLVPHSKCDKNDLYAQYEKVRGSVAIRKKDLLKIDASTSKQQCKKFGIHPSLPILKQLYDGGDALFLASIGVLTKFVTKDNYISDTGTLLFAHNTVQEEIGRLDPYEETKETASMGRLMDVLHTKDYNVNTFALDTSLAMLQGRIDHKAKSAVRSFNGFQLFNPSSPDGLVTQTTSLLNGDVGSGNGLFSDTWSSSLHDNMRKNNDLYWAQEKANLSSTFPKTETGRQLELVAKMISSHECRGSDRDIFYVETGMYDHHFDVVAGLEHQLTMLNDALSSFVSEMKSQGKWNDVTIVVTSDFGRTLTPNSGKGTDHGWSGHSFLLGGEVRGKRILGEYPTDLTGNNPLDVGRGRLIPTMPWEAPWNSVLGWMGVTDETSLNNILPNRNSFTDVLFNDRDLFDDGDKVKTDCAEEGDFISCDPNASFPAQHGKGGSGLGISPKKKIAIIVGVLVLTILFGVAIARQVLFHRADKKWKKSKDQEGGTNFSTLHTVELESSFRESVSSDSSMEMEVETFSLFHSKDQREVEIALGRLDGVPYP